MIENHAVELIRGEGSVKCYPGKILECRIVVRNGGLELETLVYFITITGTCSEEGRVSTQVKGNIRSEEVAIGAHHDDWVEILSKSVSPTRADPSVKDNRSTSCKGS